MSGDISLTFELTGERQRGVPLPPKSRAKSVLKTEKEQVPRPSSENNTGLFKISKEVRIAGNSEGQALSILHLKHPGE